MMKVVVKRLLALTLAIAMMTAGSVMGVAEGELPAAPDQSSIETVVPEQQPTEQQPEDALPNQSSTDLPPNASDVEGEGNTDLPPNASDVEKPLPPVEPGAGETKVIIDWGIHTNDPTKPRPLGDETRELGDISHILKELVLLEITMVPDQNAVVKPLDATNFTAKFTQIAGETVSDISTVLKMGTSGAGKTGFYFKATHVGTYKGVFSCSYNEETLTKEVTFTVTPKAASSVVTVGEGKEYTTVQAAIDAIAGDYDSSKRYEVIIDPGTYTEDIDIKAPIKVRSASGKPSDTTINGTVTFTAKDGEQFAQLWNVTVKGTGSGTGIKIGSNTDNDAAGSISNLIVDNFATGVVVTDRMAISGSLIQNCTVGLEINRPNLGSRSTVAAMDFHSNTTAIQVTAVANEYSFNLLASNFVNNTTNIDNKDSGTSANFAYNYFNNVTADTTDISTLFKGNVDFSPYYRAPITGRGVGDGSLTYPTITYLYIPSGSETVALPIESAKADKPIDTTNMNGREINIKLDEVDRDGAGTKMASWGFAAADSSKVGKFNPSIKPELRPASESALGALADGAKYQPVSFAHDGDLPGRATVDLVKTTADAPTTDMQLYKVVGNKLELQDDRVTFADGKYTFTRDSASDYIITDAVVTNPVTPPSTSGGGSSGGGGGGSITADDVANKLDKVPATGGEVAISVASSPNVSTGVFDKLSKSPNATLVLKGDGFTWSFAGADIGSTAGLATFNATISNTSPNATAVNRIAGTTELVNVYFAYHGKLPGKATVELATPTKYRGKTLNFYYINTKTGKPELVQSGLKPFNDKLKVSITHCSDYILTPDTIAGAAVAAAPNATSVFSNPETGGYDLRLYKKLLKLYEMDR